MAPHGHAARPNDASADPARRAKGTLKADITSGLGVSLRPWMLAGIRDSGGVLADACNDFQLGKDA